MRKFIILFLLFAPSAEAFPWKKVAELTVNFGLTAGSSLLASKAIYDCRVKFGVGAGCPDGGYGELKAREGLRFSFSIGMGTLGHYWHKSEDDRKHWDWLLAPAVPIAINTVAIIQAKTHSGREHDVETNLRVL